MARIKPPITYDADVAVSGTEPEPANHDAEGARTGRRPILDKSAPTLVYVHPTGKHQLRQYAVSQGLRVKVHDLLIEALEEWGARRGLAGPWRVESTKPRR
jgi:hypothetical protein